MTKTEQSRVLALAGEGDAPSCDNSLAARATIDQSVYASINARAAFAAPCTGPSAPMVTRAI